MSMHTMCEAAMQNSDYSFEVVPGSSQSQGEAVWATVARYCEGYCSGKICCRL